MLHSFSIYRETSFGEVEFSGRISLPIFVILKNDFIPLIVTVKIA